MLEPAEDALRRQMREELGTDVRVERLVLISEHLSLLNSREYHEVIGDVRAGLARRAVRASRVASPRISLSV